ncbi:sodium/proline symporter [Flexithrix dorotheae]|uniref:sodium/proline symporter n=1 Tax=Flexithrix dorotheae TaxID=70993 RepID=UPI0012FCDEDB|nr:sodium/proline symporter [Flexithrix dorotheae]
MEDYYVGGKKLGFWVVAFSSRATGSSAWILLGLTGMGAVFGVKAYWVALGTTSGVFVSWFLMAKKFKALTDKYNSITIPDFLVSRFNSKSNLLRTLSATALSVFVIIYVSAQIDATGTAFESFLGWDYFIGAIVGFLIVVIYMYSGGFIAVVWSDLFQGVIMLSGLVLLPVGAFFMIGNFNELQIGLREINPALLNIWGDEGFTWINFFQALGFFMIGLGYLGSPQLFIRFISIKDEKEIDKGKWVSLSIQAIMNISAITIGIFGRYLLTTPEDQSLNILGPAGQNVLISLVDLVIPLASGLYIAAVLAAIMSTIDSLLILASSAVGRDFYQKIFHPDLENQQLAKLSKWITLILALIALGMALLVAWIVPGRTIFWFVIFGWSGLAASFCPVMILSIFWKDFTEKGAIAAMIVGFLGVPIFKFLIPEIPKIGIYFSKMSELFPSFSVALFAGIIVSMWEIKKRKV